MNFPQSEKQTEHYEIGPQHKADTPFAGRMRFHQSWYRANVLRVPYDTGPGPKHTAKFGNMLARKDGAKGLNFLTPEISTCFFLFAEKAKFLMVRYFR